MRRWVLAAGLLAAVLVPSATAADLDDGGLPPPPWRGGAYGSSPYPPPGIVPPPSYRDHHDDDDDDDRAHSRYSGPPHGDCVHSEKVRDRLTNHGWRNFHDTRPVSATAVVMRARRPNGRLYELRLNRCSGEIIAIRPLEIRPYGAYAHRQPQGTWGWGPEADSRGYRNSDAYRRSDNGNHGDRGNWDERRPYAYSAPRRWHDDD